MGKKRKKLKKSAKRFIGIIVAIVLVFILCDTAEYLIIKNMKRTPSSSHENDYYIAQDFGLINIKSKYDYNQNGIDDYTDILNGGKKYAELNPKYNGNGYYENGYPPENEGVCTDVIWFALKEAGYLLKDMISKDISDTQKDGTYGIEIRDDNIDFRRVGNQEIFFMRYAEELTTDIDKIEEFMPGDIITFDDSEHIAMISDKRNSKGVPYVIQNSDEEQTEKEEDVLLETEMEITGHYRFTLTEEIKELIKKM